MTKGSRPPRSGDEEVVVLDDEGGIDDLARTLAAAERAVTAVEERHRQAAEATAAASAASAAAAAAAAASDCESSPEAGGPGPDDRLVADLQRRLMEERFRAESAEEEAGRAREALLRTVADFENLKRRTEREKSDYFRFALADALRDLLGVLDNLDRAVSHASDGAGSEFLSGVEMTARQFLDALRRQGVQEVEALGLPFDPNVHEAVMREETSEVPPGIVRDVFQKGYLLNDRLLRPAMVKVSAVQSIQSIQSVQSVQSVQSRPVGGPEPDSPADAGPGEGG